MQTGTSAQITMRCHFSMSNQHIHHKKLLMQKLQMNRLKLVLAIQPTVFSVSK